SCVIRSPAAPAPGIGWAAGISGIKRPSIPAAPLPLGRMSFQDAPHTGPRSASGQAHAALFHVEQDVAGSLRGAGGRLGSGDEYLRPASDKKLEHAPLVPAIQLRGQVIQGHYR